MPTTLKVEVVPFTLEPCPNSDFLSIAKVKGWQCVVRTVYLPVDSVVPDIEEFAFLESSTKDEDLKAKLAAEGAKYVRYKNRRVRTIKLRGIVSQGILLPIGDQFPDWKIGRDVADELGVTKYEPPETNNTRKTFGSAKSGFLTQNPTLFHRYTDIENFKNYPDVLEEGVIEVIYTEKIHGTNFRAGIVGGQFFVGSHNRSHLQHITITEPKLKSKRYGKFVKRLCDTFPWLLKTSTLVENPFVYWKVANRLDLEAKLRNMCKAIDGDSVIVYGEIYGKGIQDLTYDEQLPQLAIFDISINGNYLNWDDFTCYAHYLGLSSVPIIARGKFSKEDLKQYTVGNSIVPTATGQVREGCVVRPVEEAWDPNLGRVILKSVNEDYLLRKNRTDNH